MIVDTSAFVAVFFQEPEAFQFAGLIRNASKCRMSAANYVELSIVLRTQAGPDSVYEADSFIRRAGILVEPVTVEQAEIARHAHFEFGKGRHPAGLNFGDCFAYALARAFHEPLLFKGDDFSKTDIKSAIF